jgi:transglutaminase superfamily protein
VPRRVSAALVRVSRCFAVSPSLCFQLLTWRAVLPVLKYIVPVRTLAKLMWAAPSDGRDRARRLTALRYVFRTGGRLLVSPNCLERSLVLYRLLSRGGAEPTLVFGVSRTDQVVAGHAWIELEGRVFPSAEDQPYERLATFGAHGQTVEMFTS